MEKQITIHVAVDEQTKNALAQLAEQFRVTVSVIVRWALQDYLDRKSKEHAA